MARNFAGAIGRERNEPRNSLKGSHQLDGLCFHSPTVVVREGSEGQFPHSLLSNQQVKGGAGYVRQVGNDHGDITHKSHGYKSAFSGL